MKKGILLLLLAALLLGTALAEEVELTWTFNQKVIDSAILTDGSDETAAAQVKQKTADLTAEVKEGSFRTMYLRMNSTPSTVELQVLNTKTRKYETVVSASKPGTECVLTAPEEMTGKIRLRITYAGTVGAKITELRTFTGTQLPEGIHQWQKLEKADVLLIVDRLSAVNAEQLKLLTGTGRSVAIAVLADVKEGPLAMTDALWDAGVRVMPLFGGYADSNRAAKAQLDNWKERSVTKTVTSWIRRVQPMLLIDGGEVSALVMDKAVANAMDVNYELNDAAENGLWPVPQTVKLGEDLTSALEQLGQRDDSLLRQACLEQFSMATHSDASLIPYPADRLEDGYLAEGEFIYEDPEKGLWAYLSPTIQIQIIQYDIAKPCQRFFVTELKFKPDQEQFKQHTWINAQRKDQMIYPKTLAQSSRLVLAVNGDYHPYRVEKKHTIGNIARNYQVLYNMDMSREPGFPNLDSLALHDDGTLSVYDAKEYTADELIAMGGIRDVLSFGPYMARNGQLRIYNGKNADHQEPRSSIGMIEAGHFIFVTCEGRVPDGPKGLNVNQIGMLLYGHGCSESFLLDGGSTSVLIFMGEKLNRNGFNTYVGNPRNQFELFGIGTSEQVRTDWYNGKP